MVFLLRFLTLILSSALIEVILANSIPNRQKREHDERRLAKQQNKVYLPKELAMNLFFPASVLSAIGVLLILFPQICESVGFDYPITLFIVWIPLILSMIICSRLFVKINYNEEIFEYTNAFGHRKTFRYEDIRNIIEKNGFVTMITENKKLRFGKGLYGADQFIAYLKKRISI